MAWNKDVYFILKTDDQWTTDNPTIPSGALIFARFNDSEGNLTGVRMKIGSGVAYNDTAFVDDEELNKKLNHPFGSSSDVIFADGSTGAINVLTISDIQILYHLVTNAEWNELQKFSTPVPTLVATPQFSLADIKIGDSLSGNFAFDVAKTNNDSFLDNTGGNITVNQGVWTGTGDVDLDSLSTISISGNNPGFSTATTITFTIFGRDVWSQVIDKQEFSINVKYPIWGGTYSTKAIPDQDSLVNRVEKLVTSPAGS